MKDVAEWKAAGIVSEGQPLYIAGLSVWDHKWVPLGPTSLELPHPRYPNQLHQMRVYEIAVGDKTIKFAAGELSPNVWGFYVPA